MARYRLLRRSCVLALPLVAAAAAGSHLAAQTPQGSAPAVKPAMSFVLATDGLPPAGRWKSTPIVTDLNKDGLPDLVAHIRLGRKAGAWLGNDKGGWTDVSAGLEVPEATTCGGGVAPVDLNRDGHLDLAVADHCEGTLLFLGDGKGGWELATKKVLNPAATERPEYEGGESPFSGAEDVDVADVNGDGFPDLIVAASDRGGIIVWLGDGTGRTWQEAKATGLPTADDPGEGADDEGGWLRRLIARDMDGDGHIDLAGAYHRGPRVWKGDGKGKFVAMSEGLPSPQIYGIIYSITVEDINEDGRQDLAVAHGVNGAEVYLQQPDGTWRLQPDPMPDLRGGAQSVGLGDLDGDGHLDLVIGGRRNKGKEASYGLYVFKGDGKGGWTPIPTTLPETDLEVTWGITVADLNKDGRKDLIVTLGGAAGDQSVDLRQTPSASVGTTGKPAAKVLLPNFQVWINQPR